MNFCQKKNAGFTLIELLVVVAIIGLLSSIILVSLKEARERARIAKALNFSAQVHHALGAYAEGIWDFNDQTLKDRSGNGNDGSCTSCPSFTTDTPGKTGYALTLNGTSDYVDCGNDSSMSFDASKKYTYSVWFKVASDITDSFPSIISDQSSIASNGWDFHWNKGTQRACIEDANGKNNESSEILALEKWHNAVLVYKNDKFGLYINGDYVGGFWGDFQNSTGNFLIGLYEKWDEHFKGSIDDVRIYSEALSSAQIKKLYAEGAKKRGLLVKE